MGSDGEAVLSGGVKRVSLSLCVGLGTFLCVGGSCGRKICLTVTHMHSPE